MSRPSLRTGLVLLVAAGGWGCSGDDDEGCGPGSATVARVVDGDTIELTGGTKVRYLMIDTPESTGGADDCYGEEAKSYNAQLVEGQAVTLRYDQECEDHFRRLLAYVSVQGREVNTLMVERGFACVLHIPPNGNDRLDEFEALEAAARAEGRGMWGVCDVVACDE